MAKMWCISCQKEVEHCLVYGEERCECNCNHNCVVCGRNTLTSITVNLGDTGYSEIKQMVGEAQRIAQRTGRTGDIEVLKENRNFVSGEFETKILVYNTYSGSYRVGRQ